MSLIRASRLSRSRLVKDLAVISTRALRTSGRSRPTDFTISARMAGSSAPGTPRPASAGTIVPAISRKAAISAAESLSLLMGLCSTRSTASFHRAHGQAADNVLLHHEAQHQLRQGGDDGCGGHLAP